MYPVLSVAKYIVMQCNKQNNTISNLKLQKILYFVQAEFLVVKDTPCFSEKIMAWDFGPVVPEVYHHYKVFGSASIPYEEEDFSFIFIPEDKALIDGIIDSCAKYAASTLVEITHNQSPWKDAYQPYSSVEIKKESIKRYFKEA